MWRSWRAETASSTLIAPFTSVWAEKRPITSCSLLSRAIVRKPSAASWAIGRGSRPRGGCPGPGGERGGEGGGDEGDAGAGARGGAPAGAIGVAGKRPAEGPGADDRARPAKREPPQAAIAVHFPQGSEGVAEVVAE